VQLNIVLTATLNLLALPILAKSCDVMDFFAQVHRINESWREIVSAHQAVRIFNPENYPSHFDGADFGDFH
jgi:hypothetical protein